MFEAGFFRRSFLYFVDHFLHSLLLAHGLAKDDGRLLKHKFDSNRGRMNRRLLDPFQTLQLPEVIEEYLEQGVPTSLAFNRRGTLLAAGTHTGDVVLWDFDTRGVARVLEGHTAPVVSLSWSRNGRYLASVAKDKKLILWDVAEASPGLEAPLPSMPLKVSISPRPPYTCLVSFPDGPPLLLSLTDNSEQRLPMIGELDAKQQQVEKTEDGVQPAQPTIGGLAVYSSTGDYIIVGQSKGGILSVLDARTLRFLDVAKIPNNGRVSGLTSNRKSNLLLVNCHDRSIRLFDLQPPTSTPEQQQQDGQEAMGWDEQAVRQRLAGIDFKGAKPGSLLWGRSSEQQPENQGGRPCPMLSHVRDFNNAVERCGWSDACMTGDSEYVVGAAAIKATHHVYLWDRHAGRMERILEGPKEGIGALAWHPLRSILASTAPNTGRIYLWARSYAEKWSAFAPDFKELAENVQYVEQEDEFDWATPGASGHHDVMVAREQAGGLALEQGRDPGQAQEPGGRVVDILTADDEPVFSSDEEDLPGDQLHYLDVDVVDQEAAAAEAAEAAAATGAVIIQEDGPAGGSIQANGAAGQPNGSLSWGGGGWVKEGIKQEDSQVQLGVKRKLEDGEDSKEGSMRPFM